MPGQTSQRLYDIEPLVPLVEAGSVLLTPNYRLARRIKGEWDRRQQSMGYHTWIPIPVYALDAWLHTRWEQARREGRVPAKAELDPAQTRELWLSVIEQEREASGGYSLLQPKAAAEVAARARDNLLRWSIDTTSAAIRSEFRLDPDCGVFLEWLGEFERRLKDASLATRADCIADLLCATGPEQCPPLVLLDFDDIPPLHRDCLQILSSDIREIQSAGAAARAEIITFAEKKLELQAAADWAARHYRNNPDTTVGMVLMDMSSDRAALEYYLRRSFGCLGENYNSLPVNFSTGISLDRAPVIRDALGILRTAGRKLPLRDVVGLLQSRFTGHSDGASDLAVLFLQQLFADGLELLDTARLRTRARGIELGDSHGLQSGESLYRVFEMRLDRQRRLPSVWVEAFCEVLDAWGWPGHGPLDSLEYQQVELWYQVLEQFAACDCVCEPLDLPAALQVLSRCCQSQVSQPRTADSNIQVLGPLEAAGLRFDHLWLCGFQGSRWPAPPRPNPFLPLSIQKRCAMPHATSEREWQYASFLFEQYRRSAETLRVSFCTRVDGVPELPSPLLDGIGRRDSEEENAAPGEWLEVMGRNHLEAVVDTSAPSPTPQELARVRGGSAILEDQANCPFRAFARRRLALEPMDDYRLALSAADRGRILHDALFALWGKLDSSDALAGADLHLSAADAAREAIEAVPTNLRQLAGVACLDLERSRLEGLLLEWLEIEKQRPPFSVAAREEGIECEIRGIPLRLRLDRIDELESGERLVIDYKSGRNSLSDWLGDRPRNPQLPIYAISGENVAGVTFAEVRSRESRFLGLGDEAAQGIKGVRTDIDKAVARYSPQQSWQELLREWRRSLDRLAAEFLEGDARVDPLPRACDYCGMQALCRVEIALVEEGQ